MTRFAMDDAYPTERVEARSLVQTCADCAALAADIRAISASVARLPVAKRTRDFAISVEQAEKLRGTRLSRWLGSFATPRFGVLRPVAGVALSIGLVMAVVGTGLPGLAPAAVPDARDPRPGAAPVTLPQPAATADAAQAPGYELEPGANPPIRSGAEGQGGADESVSPITEDLNQVYVTGDDGDSFREERLESALASNPTRDILVYAGLAIAALSLGLLILAWLSRRYFADPLLR